MKGLSKSELKILELSPYVAKITEKHIIFTEQFKSIVLDSLNEGMTRVETFNKTLGVDCFDKHFVSNCLARWRRKQKVIGSLETKKGRKKSLEKMNIEEMRAEIAYQKEVIAHLKKLRGFADDEL